MTSYPIQSFVLCMIAAVWVTHVAAQNADQQAPSRHIKLEGEPNFRDIGGYKTHDGKTVKWRQVFRSGELGQLSDADVETLDKLQLKTVVNFLLPEEIKRHGQDRLPKGVNRVFDPITGKRSAELSMAAQDAIRSGDFDALPAKLNLEIHAILMDEAKEQYARLLRTLADPEKRPVAFHCSHGVHRTGTATAIVLSALGVPWETIREDYLLTNQLRHDVTERTLDRIRTQVADERNIKPEDVDLSDVEAFYVLEGSYIDGALRAAKQQYGSMEGYIRDGLGITDAEITQLKSALLE